jgi:hypothetical protein
VGVEHDSPRVPSFVLLVMGMVTFQEWTHLSDDMYQAVWLGVHLYLTVFSYTPATRYGGCGVSKSSCLWIRAKHNTPQMILSNNVRIVWTDVFVHIAMFRNQYRGSHASHQPIHLSLSHLD